MSASLALAHEVQGSGPPLVILHGLFGSARNWQSVARDLAGRYRVVRVDLRNHGHSPHAARMDYAALAADVHTLLAQLALTEVTLLGHSMGGKTAMTLALTEPTRIARLIVVDIAPVAYADQHTPVIDALLALPLDAIRRRQEADALLQAAIPDASVRLFVLQNLVLEASGARWRLNLPALKNGMAALSGGLPVAATARFAGTTDFIRGEHSARVLPAHAALIRAHFPHSSVHTVAGAGHWPHAEAPGEFTRALADCLFL